MMSSSRARYPPHLIARGVPVTTVIGRMHEMRALLSPALSERLRILMHVAACKYEGATPLDHLTCNAIALHVVAGGPVD